MRRSLALLGFPVLGLACFSASSGSGPGASFDAGFDSAEFDSSVADTEVPETGADAPADTSVPVEAGRDAIADVVSETASAPVTVTVLGFAGPEVAVPVVFQDAAGAVVGGMPLQTDSTGTVAAVVPAGGSVTVVYGTGTSLYTVLSPQPGQTITVLDWSSANTVSFALASVPMPLPLGVNDASAPYVNLSTGGHLYSILTPPPPPLGFSAYPPPLPSYGIGHFGATTGAALPILAEAIDPAGQVFGYTYAKDVALAGPANDAGQIVASAVTAWAPAVTQTYGSVAIGDGGLVSNGFYLSEVADGALVPILSSPYALHPTFADSLQLEAQLGNYQQVFVEQMPVPTVSGTLSLDASAAAAAPTITSAHATVADGGAGAGQPTVSWSLTGGDFGAMTGIVALTSWSAVNDAGAVVGSGTWTVVSPGTTQTSFSAPTLPAPLASYAPPAGATITVDNMFAVTGSAVPTYGDLSSGLSSTFWPIQSCYMQAIVPPLPKQGTAVVVLWAPTATGC